ncbi:MAG TPA: hypothetical protein VHC49_06935 [Mycobacteriales bacterium]|nr:hypothetical protein [Mycobacteriales bacterium]
MTDLSVAQHGTEIISGDPARIDELASTLRRFAVGMSDSALVLGEIDSRAWIGAGADAFRSELDLQPDRFVSGSEAFSVAAAALSRYAGELRIAQRQADLAIDRYGSGQRTSARWHASGEDVPLAPDEDPMHAPIGARPDPVDPGEIDRGAARLMVSSAQERVQQAANVLIPVLKKAQDSAPDQPSRWSWLGLGLNPVSGQKLSNIYVSVGKGVGDAVAGMGKGVWALTGAAFQDPEEFRDAWKGVGLYLEGDPASRAAFAADFVDWDQWSDDPARAFGHVATNVGTLLIGGSAATKVGLLSKGGETAAVVDTTRIAELQAAAQATSSEPAIVDGFPAFRGMPEKARFSQRNYNEVFGKDGKFAAATVERIALLLRHGRLHPTDLPVDIIRRDGHVLIMNTRSSQALTQAGIPRSQWIVRDVTGDKQSEVNLTRRLKRNHLSQQGIEEIPSFPPGLPKRIPHAPKLNDPDVHPHSPGPKVGQTVGLGAPELPNPGRSHDPQPTYQ